MKVIFGLGWLLLVSVAAIGWVMNIIAIVHAATGPLTTMLVLRIVGLFAFPLGAVLGYVS